MNVCFQESIPVIDFFSQILQRFCSHHFINFPFVYDPLHIFPTDPAMSAYLPAAGLQNKDFPASPDEQIPMRQHRSEERRVGKENRYRGGSYQRITRITKKQEQRRSGTT